MTMMTAMRCPRSLQRLFMHCILSVALVTTILSFTCTWPPGTYAASPPNIPGHLQRSQEALQEDGFSRHLRVSKEHVLPQQEDHSAAPSNILPEHNVAATFEQRWETADRHIQDLLDDEYRLKALLSPFTETGEPLLRDLTYRVRAFGRIFKIWEDLHHNSSDGK